MAYTRGGGYVFLTRSGERYRVRVRVRVRPFYYTTPRNGEVGNGEMACHRVTDVRAE